MNHRLVSDRACEFAFGKFPGDPASAVGYRALRTIVVVHDDSFKEVIQLTKSVCRYKSMIV